MIAFEKILISGLLVLCVAQVHADTLFVPKCSFSCYYDTRLGIPVKTDYLLSRDMLRRKNSRNGMNFYADLSIPLPRPNPGCYTRSGFDRGHNVPAADVAYNVQLMRETFSMVNVSPMLPAFNRSQWKNVENLVRELAVTYGCVRIITTPIFLFPDTIWLPCHHVAVPDAFRKSVLWWPNQKLLIDTLLWQRREYQGESVTITR